MAKETDDFVFEKLKESNEGNMSLEEKECISKKNDIKSFKEDYWDQPHYTINNGKPNDKSIDERSFVFPLIVGHYILFDKRKNNGPDDIISLYYKEQEYKKKKLLL